MRIFILLGVIVVLGSSSNTQKAWAAASPQHSDTLYDDQDYDVGSGGYDNYDTYPTTHRGRGRNNPDADYRYRGSAYDPPTHRGSNTDRHRNPELPDHYPHGGEVLNSNSIMSYDDEDYEDYDGSGDYDDYYLNSTTSRPSGGITTFHVPAPTTTERPPTTTSSSAPASSATTATSTTPSPIITTSAASRSTPSSIMEENGMVSYDDDSDRRQHHDDKDEYPDYYDDNYDYYGENYDDEDYRDGSGDYGAAGDNDSSRHEETTGRHDDHFTFDLGGGESGREGDHRHTNTPVEEVHDREQETDLHLESPHHPESDQEERDRAEEEEHHRHPSITDPGADDHFHQHGGAGTSMDGSVQIVTHKEDDRQVSIFAQPGMLAAFIGGAVVGLLCAILLVMFVVYRMRKKDEGSYPLDEPKRLPLTSSYATTDKEIYA